LQKFDGSKGVVGKSVGMRRYRVEKRYQQRCEELHGGLSNSDNKNYWGTLSLEERRLPYEEVTMSGDDPVSVLCSQQPQWQQR
jgi:hypothetical protein